MASPLLYLQIVQMEIRNKVPALAHLTSSGTLDNVNLYGNIPDAAYNILRSS